MTSRRSASSLAWLAALTLLSSAGCRGCGSHKAKPTPGTASASTWMPPLPPGPLLPEIQSARFAPPAFKGEPDLHDVGLPIACRIQPPLQVAELPTSKLRFLAVPGRLDALALASGDKGAPASRGLVDLAHKKSVDLPWAVLDAPPTLASTTLGFVGALRRPATGALRQVVLWRQWSSPESLLQGDRLQLADLTCTAKRCALLTSLARRTAAPGATLLVGDVDAPAHAWKHIDIPTDPGKPLSPWSLVRFEPGKSSGWVALAAPEAVELWRMTDGHAEKKSRIETPFGLYDVAPTEQPVVVAPGENPHEACKVDRFPLVISQAGEKPQTIVLTIHPSSVVTAALGRGALVMWIGPESCGSKTSMVGALLLDAHGHAVGSPMAVRNATGFALGTRGDALSLWLHTDKGLEWARGKCKLTN